MVRARTGPTPGGGTALRHDDGGVSSRNTPGSDTRRSSGKKPRRRAPLAAPHDATIHNTTPHDSKPRGSTLRQRQEAQRALAEARRAHAGRTRRLWTVLTPIGVVLLAVAVLVAVKLASNSGPQSGKHVHAAAAQVITQVTGVPAAALDAVGAGTPYALPSRINGEPLVVDSKPRVLYVGAEYCPFCAAERWPLIVALSRFGTWRGLRYAFSAAAPEVYPNTATFTFHGSGYTSQWLSFTGIETHTNQRQGNGYAPLDRLDGTDLAVFGAQDKQGSTPFVDLGGRFVIVGATYDPKLVAGKTQAQIASTLANPGDKTGAGIDAAANVITAGLCELTGGQPAAVCASAGITAAARALP